MLMKTHFLKLAAYNHWANLRVFEAMVSQGSNSETWAKLSHINLAEQTWLGRISGVPFSGPGIFETLSESENQTLISESAKEWKSLIENCPDFGQVIAYKMINGNSARSALSDILTHIFNHGTYHRAQIATIMRQSGLQPVVTDYISFSRIVQL